jgi:hypothetical protein
MHPKFKSTVKDDQCFVTVWLHGRHKVKLKVDTGSQANMIPARIHKALKLDLHIPYASLYTYTGNEVPLLGKCQLKIKCKDIDFFVTKRDDLTPILCFPALRDLNILRINDIVCDSDTSDSTSPTRESQEIYEEFKDVFNPKLYELKAPKVEIKLKDPKPRQNAPRRIPFALESRVKKELNQMVEDGIIAKVECSTEWINSMVVVEKPNKELRICLDPRDLNKHVLTDQFKIPTQDELTSKLSGSKYFAKLDAKASFWQILLEEESSYLTTFSTPFGNFRFKRLPYGLKLSSQVFQKYMTDMFGDLEGVEIYIDDILIHAPDKKTLRERLRKVLKVCKEKNLKLNWRKCLLEAAQVKYTGLLFDQEGMKIDKDRLRAIPKIPEPTCKQDLQRFLGIVTYVGKFIPNMADKTSLLRDLLKKNSVWASRV